MFTRKRLLPAAVLLTAGLAGCGGSGNGTGAGMQATDFTGFVKDQLDVAADTSAPVSINGRDFRFSDLDNPDAYADVLQ